MRIALTLTVKNERQTLRANVLLHRWIGVDQVFLYSDSTTDDTLQTVNDLPFVNCSASVEAKRFRGVPLMRRVADAADLHHTGRQVLNTYDALERAKADQFDWLIAVDADELVCPRLEGNAPGELRELLQGVPEYMAAVRFPCLEVVQRRFRCRDAFSEILFKRTEAEITRTLYDPFEDTTWIHKGFYGHRSGKSAVRVQSGAVPVSVHTFAAPDGTSLETLCQGRLLHYNLFSFENFLNKFRNLKDRPDRHLFSGRPISRHRRVWRDMVNDPRFSESDLAEYFRSWILFGESEIDRLEGQLVEVPPLRSDSADNVLGQPP